MQLYHILIHSSVLDLKQMSVQHLQNFDTRTYTQQTPLVQSCFDTHGNRIPIQQVRGPTFGQQTIRALSLVQNNTKWARHTKTTVLMSCVTMEFI